MGVQNQAGFERQCQKVLSKSIGHVLSQRDSLKQRVLTIMRLSLVFMKNSCRIIMALVAHFDLELHQMDIKIIFLNGDIEEEIYMV